jgi:hypothetical protein
MREGRDEQGPAGGRDRWRWRTDFNPYLHNVFQLLGIDDPEAPRAAFDQKLSDLKVRVEFGQAADVHGHKPNEVDVALADSMATDPNRLSEERLLVHRRHELDLSGFDEFIEQFEAMDLGRAEDMLPLPVADATPIARRLPPPAQVSESMIERPDVSELTELMKPDPRDEQVFPR